MHPRAWFGTGTREPMVSTMVLSLLTRSRQERFDNIAVPRTPAICPGSRGRWYSAAPLCRRLDVQVFLDGTSLLSRPLSGLKGR